MRYWFCLGLLLTLFAPIVSAVELSVQVNGVRGKLLANVKAYLDIEKETSNPAVLRSRVQRLHELVPDQIKRALQPFGYYKARVRSSLSVDGKRITARYQVDPGPAVRLAKVNIQVSGAGHDDPKLADAVKKLPIHVGDVFRHAPYEDAKQALQRDARDLGYLDAKLTQHSARVQIEPYRASITVRLDSGPLYRFGPVSFRQTPYTLREDLLRRYLSFKRGQRFNPAKLLDLYTALANTGYFDQISVEPDRAHAKNSEMPVVITVTPRRQQHYKLGVGYGTDTGARVSAQYWRRLNARGHIATSDIRLSQRLSSATLRYLIPLANPQTERLGFEAGFRDENTATRVSRIWQTGITRSGTRGSWRELLGLHYEFENYSIGGQSNQTRLLYPSVTWTRTRADDALYPRRGTRLQFDLLGGSRALASDVSFFQARAAAKWVRSLGAENRFIARAEAGATVVSSINALPASKRFFAGGDQSVRGYGYETLGPKDAAGAVVGGKYLLVGSIEYERHIVGNWSGALFYDIGNAFNDSHYRLARGAGFGVRWRSPVGPVRIDLAWALSEPGTPVRLHVLIGPDL